MGAMKRLHTQQMLRAQRPVRFADAVALPRCKCGCRRYALALTFGPGKKARARARVDATCNQCATCRNIHRYRGRLVDALILGPLKT